MKKRVVKYLTIVCFLLLGIGSVVLATNKTTPTNPAYAAEDGVTDFVSRLYSEILGREADANGLDTWTNALTSGTFSGTEVAKGFIMSDEFLNKDMTNEEFVQILYRAFFGREADANGLQTWVDFLDQGYRKSYVFAGFANSDEFVALCDSYEVAAGSVPVTISEQQPNLSDEDYNIWLFVERMYTEVLDRPADMAGIQSWVDVLKDGTWTGAQVASGFIMSNEFLGKEITSEEYVKIMYMAFFGREADENGLNLWVNGLESGEYSKEYIFAGFANSAEFGGLCSNYGITQGEVEIPEITPTPENERIGMEDCTTLFWTEFSDTIKVEPGTTETVVFKNYNSGLYNWHNFITVIQNIPDVHTAENNQEYCEYAVLRADNFGWGSGYNEAVTKSNWNWDTFIEDMNGATVELMVTNLGTTVNVEAHVITAKGNTYYQKYRNIAVDGDVYYCLTIEGGYLDIVSPSTTSKAIYERVGNTNRTTPFWTEFSDTVKVEAGTTETVVFKNYNGVSNWNNFIVALQNVPDVHNNIVNTEYLEYAVVRADNFGWGAGFDIESVVKECNWVWDTFPTDMNGATVELSITNHGTTVDVVANVTTATGAEYYQKYLNIAVDGDVYYCLTADGDCLDIMGPSTTTKLPSTSTQEIPFVVYTEEDVEIYRAEAGVIITVKDGYCGAVNYEGDILVPHKYVSVWQQPNADGMFALEDETGDVVVFNANGKQIYRLPVQYDASKTLESLAINEGVLTYDYDGGGIGDVIICAYDLVEGKTLYYNDGETEDGSVSLLMDSRTTAMKDGKFYYSVDCLLISVDRNGNSKIVYENPYWMASPGGKVWYTSAPNGEYGFAYLYNEYEWSFRLGLISTDGEKVSMLKIDDLAEVLGVEWDNCVVKFYYPDGVRQSNAGTQAVVYLEYDGEVVTDYILLDFAKAEYDTFDLVNEYSGEVVGSEVRISNVEELIVAQYDYISLSDSAYYLAGEENDWFYLDKNGRVAADYVDCADFYNGYAAVIKEDGMVYLVDEEFNETATGYAANSVHTSNAGFTLVTDEGEILLIIDEDAPIRQPEKADFVDYYAEGVEIISVGQEVILTYKDGYCGAVDYDGNQLVAYEYPSAWTRINDDGMFALINDNGETVIFGPDGTELYRLPASMENEYGGDMSLAGLNINEGVVTYAYGDWMEGYVGAYDLKTGVKFYEADTWFTRGRVTAMKDGVFYYSSGYQLYAVNSYGYDWVVYDNSEFGLSDPGGEVRYINAPNGDYGFVFVNNDYEGTRLGILNKNSGEISMMTYYDLEAALGVENTSSCYVTGYWGDGTWYNVLNQQAVMYMNYEDDSTTKYALLDFSKAEFAEFEVYNHLGEAVGTEVRISNPEELIVAQYDSITLSESGYYLASNNDDWFYIDKNGEVVADYVDCASFYNGYAAVIKEDGMVYLIDECFNETETGYVADGVYSNGAGFVVVKDGTERVLIVK